MRSIILSCGFLAANAAIVYYPMVERTETCIIENFIPPPPYRTPVKIRRLAWPQNGILFNTLPSLNNVDSTGGLEPICLGCDSPPCGMWEADCLTFPCESLFRCTPENLWWSVIFENLIVYPGQRITIQSGDAILPTDLAVLYEEYYPLPSPSVTPYATVMPSPSQCVCPALNKNISHLYSSFNFTQIANACGDRTSNVVMAIFLGIFCAIFVVAGSLSLEKRCKGEKRQAQHVLSNVILCPYCESNVADLRIHLKDCVTHLNEYAPVLVDNVRIIDNEMTAEEHELLGPENAVPEPIVSMTQL
jgi:hypothetical protein